MIYTTPFYTQTKLEKIKFTRISQTLTETFTIPYGVSSLKYETMRKIENSHLFTLKGLNLTTTPVGILMEDTRLREESNNLFRQKLNEMVQWYRTNNL